MVKEELIVRKLWLLGIWLTLCAPLFASDTRELVLFPFGTTSAVQQPEDFNLNAELMGALYAQLKDIPNLYVWRFRENNPSVRRALDENRLRRDRLNPPFNEREPDGTFRSARVGAIVGAQYALAGTIAEFRYDPNTREAVITVSVDLVQVGTNELLVSIGETGRGRLTRDESDPNLAYIRAVAEVAQKIAPAIRERLAPAPQAAPQQTEKKADRRRERTVLGLFLLLLGVGFELADF